MPVSYYLFFGLAHFLGAAFTLWTSVDLAYDPSMDRALNLIKALVFTITTGMPIWAALTA